MSRVGVVATAVVLLLAGCAANGPSATDAVQRFNGTTALVVVSESAAAMEAQVVGTLGRTESGCLALKHEGRTYVLQLPLGSRLNEDGRGVEVPGIGLLALGDRVDGGGGYHELADVPVECRLGTEIAVWQTVTRPSGA